MKRLIKLTLLIAVLALISRVSQAKDYYYFFTIQGLMAANEASPFYGGASVALDIDPSISTILNTETNATFDIALSSPDVDVNDVSLSSVFTPGSITGISFGGSGSARTIIATLPGTNLTGDTEVEIVATVDGNTFSKIVNLSVASNCSISIDTTAVTDPTGTAHTILCDDADNYLISSMRDLLHLSYNQSSTVATGATTIGEAISITGSYRIINNITFPEDEELVDWSGNGSYDGAGTAGWLPLDHFQKDVDGGGNIIKNLYINRPTTYGMGFMSKVFGQIKDLGLENVDITGEEVAGGFAGELFLGGSIDNVYVTGTVTGTDAVGGLAGNTYDGASVNNVYVTGTVTGNDTVGGLVGGARDSIQNSYSEATVNGASLVGGLFGQLWDSTVYNSYHTGDVTATGEKVGGLVGSSYGTCVLQDVYAIGNVEGTELVGGLVGENFGAISTSYAGGIIKGTHRVGGLVGETYGNIEKSYSYSEVDASGYNIGGFTGNNFGIASNCYATGDVISTGYNVGGFVGENYGTISDSLSLGPAEGLESSGNDDSKGVGGFVGGVQNPNISDCSTETTSISGDGNVGGFAGWAGPPVSGNYATSALPCIGRAESGGSCLPSVPYGNWSSSAWDISGVSPKLIWDTAVWNVSSGVPTTLKEFD